MLFIHLPSAYFVVKKRKRNKSILKGSDDGVLQSGLLTFWTSSIVWYSKKYQTMDKVQKLNSPK
jgi:hypothetical protein